MSTTTIPPTQSDRNDLSSDPISELVRGLPTDQLKDLLAIHHAQADALSKRQTEIAQATARETRNLERDKEFHLSAVQLIQREQSRRQVR